MKITTSFIALILMLLALNSYSQTVDAPYKVGTWFDFRKAAVSFTFDDGSPNQYSKVVPIFNEFDMNFTWFIVTGENFGWPANWEKLKQAAADGHEIASHTVTHTSFGDISDSLETIELQESREKIESNIPGEKCITMAYPYCVTGNKSILSEYYLAARICSGAIEPKTPRDFMAISSIICGTEGSVKTADNFLSKASSAIRTNGWCVYLLHGVDNDGGWSPVTSSTLRETLQLFKDNSADFWVDTFGNVVRYIKERNNVSVVETAATDSSFTVQITDELDDEIFNCPVSIRRTLPEGWFSASASQNDEPLDAKIISEENVYSIQFDVIPDKGDVFIAKEIAAAVQSQSKTVTTFSLEQNYPNPFNPQTTIKYALPSTEFVSIRLFDVNGKLVRTLLEQHQAAGSYSVTLDGQDLSSGIYHYTMQAGSFKQTKRLLLLK